MNEPKTPFDPDTSEQTLRSRANDRLRSPDDPDLELMSPEETRRLVHELRVYQVELEIQNEDLRRAQEELEASRARFADLYDFAPAGYLTVSETGLIIEANLTVANQLGVARGTLLKQPLTRFILAAEQDVYYRHREVLFETGRQQTCELRLLRADNPPLWALLEATLAEDEEQGRPVCRVVVSDITERKQAEEMLRTAYNELEVRVQERTAQLSVANTNLSVEIAEHKQAEQTLHESKQKYRTLADHAVDWEYWVGKENEMLYMSPSFERITGYPLGGFAADLTLLGRIIHPDDLPLVESHRHHITNQENCSLDFRIIRQDGAVRWLGHVCQPVYGNVGQYQGRRASNRDITESKQRDLENVKAEIRHRQLQKAESLGRMAGAIAHDYNNLLGAVMGNLDLAMDGLDQGLDVKGNLTNCRQAVLRAKELSRLMLTYIGEAPGHYEPLDLSGVCRKSMDMLRHILPKEADLQADLPSPGPTIKADAHHIRQVFTNLVTNAWEATGNDRGSIRLTVATVSAADIPAIHRFPLDWQPEDECYACLEVGDAGCGIAEEAIDFLFDPFFTNKFKGRGLGLPVVLGIVRAHHGAVTVESRLESGSTFRVFLPISAEEVTRSEILADDTLEIRGGGMVLMVDDEMLLRGIARAVLQEMGFEVLEARDGLEAVEMFRQQREAIQFVLCDVIMPHMDGWEIRIGLPLISPKPLRSYQPTFFPAQYMEPSLKSNRCRSTYAAADWLRTYTLPRTIYSWLKVVLPVAEVMVVVVVTVISSDSSSFRLAKSSSCRYLVQASPTVSTFSPVPVSALASSTKMLFSDDDMAARPCSDRTPSTASDVSIFCAMRDRAFSCIESA